MRASEAALKRIMAVAGATTAEPRQPHAVYDAVVDRLDFSLRHGTGEGDTTQNRVFDAVLSVERHARRLWFWVSGVFFGGGLALFVWVVVEGAVEVCKPL